LSQSFELIKELLASDRGPEAMEEIVEKARALVAAAEIEEEDERLDQLVANFEGNIADLESVTNRLDNLTGDGLAGPWVPGWLESLGVELDEVEDMKSTAYDLHEKMETWRDQMQELRAGVKGRRTVLAAYPGAKIVQPNLMLPHFVAEIDGEEVEDAVGTTEWEVWEVLADLHKEGKLFPVASGQVDHSRLSTNQTNYCED
jgi:hypothetical protein